MHQKYLLLKRKTENITPSPTPPPESEKIKENKFSNLIYFVK